MQWRFLLVVVSLVCFGVACEPADENADTADGTDENKTDSATSDSDNPSGNVETVSCTREDVPSTENGAVIGGNRYFFIGPHALYELMNPSTVAKDADDVDVRSARCRVVVTREDCDFTGLTSDGDVLYAACAAMDRERTSDPTMPVTPILWSELVRVAPSEVGDTKDVVTAVRLEGPNFFPNGMAVDDGGRLYVTNSYSAIAEQFNADCHDALIRVEISGTKTMALSKTALVDSARGGGFPNGVQLNGNRLWFTSQNVMYQATIGDANLADFNMVFEAPETRFLDDLAVLPNNLLAVTNIPNPDFSDPNWPPVDDLSEVTFLEVLGDTDQSSAATVISSYVFEHPDTPSSAAVILNGDEPVLYVTDFFSGGVQSVSLGTDYLPL